MKFIFLKLLSTDFENKMFSVHIIYFKNAYLFNKQTFHMLCW